MIQQKYRHRCVATSYRCVKSYGLDKCRYYDSEETPYTQIDECKHKMFSCCTREEAKRDADLALEESRLIEKLEEL